MTITDTDHAPTDPATADPEAAPGTPADGPPAAVETDQLPPRWFAVEVTDPDGHVEHRLALGADELGTQVADLAATGDLHRLLVAAVTPVQLAGLQIVAAFTPAAPPAPDGEAPAVPAAGEGRGRLPTAEEASAWGPEQWLVFLEQEKVTRNRALADLSRATGRTVGLEDVHGRPDLAMVLLAYARNGDRG